MLCDENTKHTVGYLLISNPSFDYNRNLRHVSRYHAVKFQRQNHQFRIMNFSKKSSLQHFLNLHEELKPGIKRAKLTMHSG